MSITALTVPTVKVNGGVSKSIEDLLEANITHAPLTIRSISTFFDALDPEEKGYVSTDVLCQWYRSLEFIGANPTDQEIEYAVTENIHTIPDGLTFDEFTIFILKISRW